jgi:hypothetical protein
MAVIGRRNVLQALAAVPALAKSFFAFEALPDDVVDRRHLARRILRMVNTAEHWHLTEFGSYIGVTELTNSPALTRLRDDPTAEKFNIGATLLSEVSLSGPEVFPGWGLRISPVTRNAADADGNGYTAVVREASGEHRYALVSDESGRIYEGSVAWGSAYDSDPRVVHDVLRNATLADDGAEGTLRRAGRLLKRAAFLNVASQAAHVCAICCPCGPIDCIECDQCCSCFTTWSSGCWNCGCENCIWICCCIVTE